MSPIAWLFLQVIYATFLAFVFILLPVVAEPYVPCPMEKAIQSGNIKGVVEAEYLGYTGSLPVDWGEGVIAHYRLIESFKAQDLPAKLDVKYDFIKGSMSCYPPSDWKFSKRLMPTIGSHSILFLTGPYNGRYQIWWTADVLGELPATPTNIETVRNFFRLGTKANLDMLRHSK